MSNTHMSSMLPTEAKKRQTNGFKETAQSDAITNLLTHHLSSFLNNDLEAVMSDYTSESILITQAATYVGLNEIRGFFTHLMTYFPTGNSNFQFDKMIVKGQLGYIVWHAKTPTVEAPLGSDTFIIEDGKISQQTFVGQLNFIN